MHSFTLFILAGALSSAVCSPAPFINGSPATIHVQEQMHTQEHVHVQPAAGGRLRRSTTTSTEIISYDLDDSPMKESPKVTGVKSKATGKARVTYIPAIGLIAAKVSYRDTNSPLIGLHLHQGNSTTNGPVIVNFCSQSPLPAALTNGSVACVQQKYGAGQWYLGTPWAPYNASSVEELLLKDTKNTYFNLHTTESFNVSGGNGLIRHQTKMKEMTVLEPVPTNKATKKNEKMYAYTLEASPEKELPEVTNVTSNATGTVTIGFIPSSGLFIADVTYNGIDDEVIGMHLHAGNSSVNGAPLVVFCGSAPLPSVLVNFTVPCVQGNNQTVRYVGNLVQGVTLKQVKELLMHEPQNAYFNIHDLRSFELAGANGLIRQQTSIVGGFDD